MRQYLIHITFSIFPIILDLHIFSIAARLFAILRNDLVCKDIEFRDTHSDVFVVIYALQQKGKCRNL